MRCRMAGAHSHCDIQEHVWFRAVQKMQSKKNSSIQKDRYLIQRVGHIKVHTCKYARVRYVDESAKDHARKKAHGCVRMCVHVSVHKNAVVQPEADECAEDQTRRRQQRSDDLDILELDAAGKRFGDAVDGKSYVHLGEREVPARGADVEECPAHEGGDGGRGAVLDAVAHVAEYQRVLQ